MLTLYNPINNWRINSSPALCFSWVDKLLHNTSWCLFCANFKYVRHHHALTLVLSNTRFSFSGLRRDLRTDCGLSFAWAQTQIQAEECKHEVRVKGPLPTLTQGDWENALTWCTSTWGERRSERDRLKRDTLFFQQHTHTHTVISGHFIQKTCRSFQMKVAQRGTEKREMAMSSLTLTSGPCSPLPERSRISPTVEPEHKHTTWW